MNFLRTITRAFAGWWTGLRRSRQLAYLAILLLVLLLMVTTGQPGAVLRGLWEILNLLFAVRVSFWALFHPRVLFRVRPTLFRWSFGVACLLVVFLHALLEKVIVQATDLEIPGGMLFFLCLLISLPFAWLGTFVVSAFGAAIGGFLARHRPQQTPVAKVGIMGLWLTLLAILLLRRLVKWLGLPGDWSTALLGGLPLLVLWLVPIARHLESESVAQWLVRWLQNWWVWHFNWRGHHRRLDLRPTLCVLAGCGLAFALAGLGLLAGMQTATQVWLISQRHSLARLGVSLNQEATTPLTDRLVLLEWDNPALRQASRESSESAVQAQLVKRLAELGVACFVVPPPTLEWHPRTNRWSSQLLPLGPAEIAANLRDLPSLQTALRDAKNTILALPSVPGSGQEFLDEFFAGIEEGMGPERSLGRGATNASADLEPLRAAARQVGRDEAPGFHSATLPTISLRTSPESPLPVPLLVAAALSGHPAEPIQPLPGFRALVQGRTNSLIADATILIDFNTRDHGVPFLRVPISAVLEDRLIFARGRDGIPGWLPARDFLRDKAVFLEPLVPQPHATPVGEMPRMEVLAFATETVWRGSGLRCLPRGRIVGESLVCALLVGLLCGRTGLVARSWRLLVILVVVLGISVAAFLSGVWLDPVLPLATALTGFLLLVQLTLTLERQAKEQNRRVLQRFVAPEVVQKMLENPATRLALGGQRERLAILFADVRGFSRFAEAHSPEEVIKVVNAYLQVMTDALHQYGGILDKYTGDGLMAMFRLPPADPAGVIKAVHAALAMRDATLELSTNRAAGGDSSLQVGIALHVGEAVVGLVGNATRQVGFTCLGHTVVVAARLQTLAQGGEAIISEEVRSEVAAYFELEPRPAVPVKGVSAPLACYRVLCAKPALLAPS